MSCIPPNVFIEKSADDHHFAHYMNAEKFSGSMSPTSIIERRFSGEGSKERFKKPMIPHIICDFQHTSCDASFPDCIKTSSHSSLGSPTNALFVSPQEILKSKYRQRYLAEMCSM